MEFTRCQMKMTWPLEARFVTQILMNYFGFFLKLEQDLV